MKKLFLLLTISIALLSSCTKNQRARNFGGTEEIKMKPNEKLINVTWKETNMWVLSKDTVTNISYFRESSSFGVWEGEIIIKP